MLALLNAKVIMRCPHLGPHLWELGSWSDTGDRIPFHFGPDGDGGISVNYSAISSPYLPNHRTTGTRSSWTNYGPRRIRNLGSGYEVDDVASQSSTAVTERAKSHMLDF